jgi:hypothetical protein
MRNLTYLRLLLFRIFLVCLSNVGHILRKEMRQEVKVYNRMIAAYG